MSSFPNVITTGHDAEGKAIFVDSPEQKEYLPNVRVLYRALDDGAVDLNEGADLKAHAGYDPKASSIFPKAGSGVVAVEWPPGLDSSDRLHRTLTVDFGYLMEGQIECHLDSGEKRTIKTGEIFIQRGTNHYWVNPSKTESAKALIFVIPSKPVAAVKDDKYTVT